MNMQVTMTRPKHRAAWMGTEYAITLTAGDSAGLIGVFEGLVPAGDGPPIHIHHREDEVLHVLEGDYEFWLDGRTSRGVPGHVGLPAAGRPAHLPGARQRSGPQPRGAHAGWLRKLIQSMRTRADLRIPADMDAIGELAERYGLEYVETGALGFKLTRLNQRTLRIQLKILGNLPQN